MKGGPTVEPQYFHIMTNIGNGSPFEPRHSELRSQGVACPLCLQCSQYIHGICCWHGYMIMHVRQSP